MGTGATELLFCEAVTCRFFQETKETAPFTADDVGDEVTYEEAGEEVVQDGDGDDALLT